MRELGGERLDGPYIISLTDPTGTDSRLVGGKGANLARLATSGFPIPDGFCVTTVAYQRLINTSTREAIASLSKLERTDSEAIAEAAATVRKLIQELEFPEDVRDAITETLNEEGFASTETYAVRSSATAEDLPDASFAGQQETFLNVQGVDAVIDRVRECMASLFTERAIAYRAENGVPHEDVSIAVVVQRMVSPDVSGVLFTADPQTGNRHTTTIEACLGLGEVLVSGEANVDSITVDARTGDIRTYEVGDQQVAVRLRPTGGTETVELPGSERSRQVLTDDQVQALVKIGREIESLFDQPQDIEWSVTDDEIVILQARPITSLFPLPSPTPDDNRLHVYISMGHGQSFAEAMPPLVVDLWKSYVQTLFTEYGLDPDTQWVVEAGGRIYLNVSPALHSSLLRKRFPEKIGEANEQMGAAIGDLLDRRGKEFHKDRTLLERLGSIPTVTSTAWDLLRESIPKLVKVFGGFVGAFIGDPVSPDLERARWETWGKNIASQVKSPEDLSGQVHAVFGIPPEATQFPAMGSLIAGNAAEGKLERRFPDAPDDVNAVGRGLPQEMLTKVNLGIGDLADVAREYPAVIDALNRDSPLEEIAGVEGGNAFRSELAEFLDSFGHRATGEMDISRPRWRDDPSVLLSIVQSTVKTSDVGEHRARVQELEQEALAAGQRLEQRAANRLFGSLRRRIVSRLIRTYRDGIQTREYPKHGVAYFYAAWHEVLRDAGEHLASQGKLVDADDVWFLRKEELFDVLDGEPVDANVAVSREEFSRYASMDAPPVLTSDGEALGGESDREDIPAGALVGTGVSEGTVEGVARVVRNPREERIEKDEILVAPSSDPGWTPLFLNAAGVVVEVGGQMSHGSLVAREYGIPAVVSVPNATKEIQTGQWIRVDGTNGIVELLDRES